MRANPLRVHLVEDSPIMARLLLDLVEETPAKVVGQSTSAAGAIRDIIRTKPDVAIVDIGLAEGSGFDVIKALAARRPRPLVFVLTNHATKPYREHAARLGADAFYDQHSEIIALLQALTSLATTSLNASLPGLGGESDANGLPKDGYCG
jgi:DNA-binding NarL/FixJ family response regulator